MSDKPPLRVNFFTICASNYLASAIALGRSVSTAHGGSRLTVFLLDDPPAEVAGVDHIHIVPARTTMPLADWHHYQCFYGVLELATSIKPLCFEHVLAADSDLAIYLDPDIVVFKALDAVTSAIRDGYEVVLTPHILTPLPADGKTPSDLSIMRAGIYNLGFAAFANTARNRAIIAWWGRQLRTQGLVDVNAGLFTDQKWIDFIPALSPSTFIIREPGYNVAYWNLHERTLTRAEDGWRVTFLDGSQSDLAFFHFSGYAPSADQLSKHETRYRSKPPGDTRQILGQYSELLTATGYCGLRERGVAAPRFENGIAWDPVCRILYREILLADPDFGDPLKGDALLNCAAEVGPGDHVPRYVRAILRLRPDVAGAYDDGRNKVGLLGWLEKDGPAQLGVERELLRHLGIEGRLLLGGVNYIGYFRSHLGIGEAARNAVAALGAAGVEVAPHDISHLAESPTGNYAIDLRTSRARYEMTILGFNADATPYVLGSIPEVFRSTFLIGSWAWETPDFPEEWCDRFNLVDEVWVASTFVAEAVRAKATVPVLVVPYAVVVPEVKPDKAWLARICPDVEPEEFTFICFLDIGSISFRKNPHGAIEAFMRAFKPHEPVRLIVKVLNGERDPDLLESLHERSAGHRITIWDVSLEPLDRFRLLASIDAFVSLHRSEGFGLVIAEAMAIGRPVIVTNWSGNADFTNGDNAALVRYDLIRSQHAHGPYRAGTVWAEPDLDDAARQMQRVWKDTAWRNRIVAAAAKTIGTRFSPEVVGAIIKSRLERLSASARHYEKMRRDSLPVAAAPAQRPTIVAALKAVSRDAWRRLLFYLARAPRLPRLLSSEGLNDLLTRVAQHARDRDIGARQRLSFRKIVLRIWLFFGWGRVEQRENR
jgi:glycosyltransferase involved in cell wall biosynthesis